MSKAIMERHVAEIRTALLGLDGKSGMVKAVADIQAEQGTQNLAIQAAQAEAETATKIATAGNTRLWRGLLAMVVAAGIVVAERMSRWA